MIYQDKDSIKLLVLAKWLDRTQKKWWVRKLLGWSNSTDVQDDLRKIADRLQRYADKV